MWPSALQLTRDECRGILRRLELESYSNVMSVFRAQGGLNDTKSKLLDDLRNIFHISQERHRAEARRVANDEQLSTIAEAISGPNTWQEWSREGRRPYPLLPRVPPQTALCITANHVAAVVTNENSKLPYPSDTGKLQTDHQEFSSERSNEAVPIVTSDPLQTELPDLRKTLKRNLPAEALSSTKKRLVSEISPSATANEPPLSPATQIRKLYHNHSKTQSKQKNTLAKKATNSPMKRPTAAAAKKRLTSGESVDSNKPNNASTAAVLPSQSLAAPCSTVTSAPNVEQIPQPPSTPTPSQPQSLATSSSSLSSQEIPNEPLTTTTTATATTTTIPQIATSKKDISKNLSKLNLITNQPLHQAHPQEKHPECKTEKLSTPVQKYIVEERTPTLPTHLMDKQQVITNKLKPMTAIVPSPLSLASKAKVTSVKTIKSADILCSTPVSSQPQVFNVIDASTPPYLPHTPPAIINISSKFEPEHGKVLKTKLLPLMLSSSSKLESSNGSPTLMKSSSSTGTLFRKPNIIKSGMPTIKQKIQITNQQIITPPSVAGLKMSPHLHLKGVPGGGPIHNRNSVKIFSSPNGKMFIQSADSGAKQMTKVNTLVTGQKGLMNTCSPSGRIAIQKVHIIPAPAASSPTVGTVTMPKPIAITKPNMLFMPMGSTQSVKGMPIVKSNKFTTVLPTQMAQESNSTTAKNNVIVIGAVPSMSQTLPKNIQGFNNRSNMITEDTPVDIITTPLIVDVDSIGSQSIKPTETIDLTTIADTSNTPPPPPTPQSSKAAAVTVLPAPRVASDVSYTESINKVENEATVPAREEQNSMVIGVTDWEMELDQEASKTRAIKAEKVRRRNSVENMLIGSGPDDDESGSSDEHSGDDDVIEDLELTDDEIEMTDVGQDQGEHKLDKLSNEKGQDHQVHQQHQYDDDEEETIEVGDEHMKSSEGDVIQYDESYESTNDELDDNIAIEYVEEEQDSYEEKIEPTSSDQKDTMECNSNIVLIKQSAPNLAADPTESSENKSQSSTDCMVSVEEISSTTQQNTSASQNEH